MNPALLYRREWDAAQLLQRNPPRFACSRKRRVFELACPPASPPSGRIVATRWRAGTMPGEADLGSAIRRLEVRPGYFTYDPGPPDRVDWHVNFAHPDAFAFYGQSLFAQDEWQVAEHPLLGCVREALSASAADLRTLEADVATPLLVYGVERCCEISTGPDALAGRPNGLYGHEFARASLQAIGRAVRRLEPPTRTNVIAIAAPAYGQKQYQRSELRQIVATAYAGFRAAVIESEHQFGRPVPVAIHTGFWGCGAFGGNRVVMMVMQVVAAGMAGVDLCFHAGGPADAGAVRAALEMLDSLDGDRPAREAVLDRVAAGKFEWGVSNGT